MTDRLSSHTLRLTTEERDLLVNLLYQVSGSWEAHADELSNNGKHGAARVVRHDANIAGYLFNMLVPAGFTLDDNGHRVIYTSVDGLPV